MQHDCYKVEVLSYLNPHLIWIEVHDPSLPENEYLFEQIGVYGVLPLDVTIDIESPCLKSKKCDEWKPAAAVVMRDFFDKSGEIWFSPTHIDRRTSIFDDNIHKYGDLIIKADNGKKKTLSKHLLKSGFAYNDVCEFHEKLNSGKLKTKLSPIKTHKVIKELENYYLRKDRPKNSWKQSVDRQTSVFQISQNFESSLPVSNFERDNNDAIYKTLKNKYKDFKLCKDVDEESVGRACRRMRSTKQDTNKNKTPIGTDLKKSEDLNYTYNNILNFLDTNSKVKTKNQVYGSPSSSENNACTEIDDIGKKELKGSILGRHLKTFNELKKIKKSMESESACGIKTKVEDKIAVGVNKSIESTNNFEKDRVQEDSKVEQKKHKKNDMFQKTSVQIENYDGHFNENMKSGKYNSIRFQETSRISNRFGNNMSGIHESHDMIHKTSKPAKHARAQDSSITTQIAYGPPGLAPTCFKIQLRTDPAFEEDEEPEIDTVKEVGSEKRECIYGEVDSEVGILITNKNTLNSYFNYNVRNTRDNRKTVQNDVESLKSSEVNDNSVKSDVSNKTITNNVQKVLRSSAEIISSDDLDEENSSKTNQKENDIVYSGETNSDDSVDKISSSLIKRKLRVYQNAVERNRSFTSSDTSNKDSSSDVTSNKKTNGDESIEKVIEKLNLKYKNDNIISKKEDKPKNEVNVIKLKNNVNPFKNIDPNLSVFVDKLVTPVLMVHSKDDYRIQPVFEIRNLHFNSHIHNILKNMSIDRPMMLQTISWFVILRGYSLFMVSPMGSGKTLGYLPAVCRLVSDSKSLNLERGGPACIIVCATAQSVANVEKMAKMFLESREKVLACYAGVDNLHVTTSLLNGCDLLICTPSALVRLLQATEFGVDLRSLSTFVLDDCERLSEVYADEIKFFMHYIKEMLNTRADKHLKVQYVLASRVWCNFMEPLAKKVPDTVICIGAFQECVLYSKANTSVSLVEKVNKVDSVLEFLKDINTSKRTVIVCQLNNEVALLEKALKRSKHVVFSCDNNMTIHDLYNLSVSWADYEEPLIGPILICCDANLMHMNITDAHNLIHFSMPSLFSMFCKRFSVLNDNYPSIFKEHSEIVKIKVLLEKSNVEQLPKILKFIKRCTDNAPSVLDTISSGVLAKKDEIKAKNCYPLCDSLLSLGYCPDIYNCQERHTILKEYDSPVEWLPKEGTITCKILHYHSATTYSARLQSCTVNGVTTNYPQTYSQLSMKMGAYYSQESNKKLHGIPKVGDICATAVKQNFYLRCQVLKILSKYERGNPNKVLVKLIDEERMEVTRDIYLYHLPDKLKQVKSQAVIVRLANIEPKDKDITFSDLARDRLKNITDSDAKLFVRGKVCLTLGNCIFVNTLEACEDLTSLNEVVEKYNLKQELLENHAIPNPQHLVKLEKLCAECGLTVKKESKMLENKLSVKNLPKGAWAHLESDTMSSVIFASGVNPDKFFVRLYNFESCMIDLLQDIKKHVKANPTPCADVKEGEIVLAKFPDDDTYERARIDSINEDTVKCFFVDQGDWWDIPLNQLVPITEQLINQLPFQAIECRLVGVQPVGDQWTEFSMHWFLDNCINETGSLKCLFVKYFTKEPAEFTNGHKYSVAVIDTNGEEDVIFNLSMIDLNLAAEKQSEIMYLDELENKKPEQDPSANTVSDHNEEAAYSREYIDQEPDNTDEKSVVPPHSNILLKAPIRSVPLVNDDNESDDSDKWDIQAGDNVVDSFPMLMGISELKGNLVNSVNTIGYGDALNKPEVVTKKAEVEIELDSDDLTSPDGTYLSNVSTKKSTSSNTEIDQKIEPSLNKIRPVSDLSAEANDKRKPELNLETVVDQKRRPKLVWRQNKISVCVKIQLIGADNYKLNIEDRSLDFSAEVNDTDFAFKLELYGLVDKEKCSHVNKGQYILVKLKKVSPKNWITLTRDDGIKKWIVYDVDNLEASSDEETIDDTVKDIVKNIRDNVESDSEEESICDDINSGYKKYD